MSFVLRGLMNFGDIWEIVWFILEELLLIIVMRICMWLRMGGSWRMVFSGNMEKVRGSWDIVVLFWVMGSGIVMSMNLGRSLMILWNFDSWEKESNGILC